MSRRSRSFFSELVNATTKRFYMMVNYPLSRGLGNIAKVYLIKCSQSTCAKLKKIRILSRRSRWNCPYIYHIIYIIQYTFCTHSVIYNLLYTYSAIHILLYKFSFCHIDSVIHIWELSQAIKLSFVLRQYFSIISCHVIVIWNKRC